MGRRYCGNFEEEKATRFKIDVPDLEEYKTAWLAIHNTAKTEREIFYKVYNDYDNGIYVIANRDYSDKVRSYLSQFDENLTEEETIAVLVSAYADYDDFDKDYIDCEYALGETD